MSSTNILVLSSAREVSLTCSNSTCFVIDKVDATSVWHGLLDGTVKCIEISDCGKSIAVNILMLIPVEGGFVIVDILLLL